MKIYLVGGAVRDQLLHYPVLEHDWVVVGASPAQMTAQGFVQVGKDFPVFLHPKTKDEYALARIERKIAPGYSGFSFDTSNGVTLEQDLARRDLTINAIAQADDGSLIDPYGGQQDLQNKQLRHVSDAFSEDPVRILRIARFAARYHHLGFSVAPETQKLMQRMVAAGEVDALVPERVWKETARALGEQNPEQFIQVLKNCGALARIMPELDDVFGVPQPPQHHPEIDTGLHSLLSLQHAANQSSALTVRFATLVHDLGKACTPADILPSHHGHERAGLKKVKSLCRRLCVPNDSKKLALAVCEYHTHCHRALELNPSTLNKLFNNLGAYKNKLFFEEFALCCEADAKGRTGLEKRPYPQVSYLRDALNSCADINAQPFMAQGLQGPAIGIAINEARIKRLKRFKGEYLKNESVNNPPEASS
ncbi:multifunctional CCA addition/repair protein [Marinagarivorans algicola]|uniref:multifunctional CCA addition/repair protein n=1 Tax=Marinagarivorans algicola TaxID=1513270 RepID=UPI003734F815